MSVLWRAPGCHWVCPECHLPLSVAVIPCPGDPIQAMATRTSAAGCALRAHHSHQQLLQLSPVPAEPFHIPAGQARPGQGVPLPLWLVCCKPGCWVQPLCPAVPASLAGQRAKPQARECSKGKLCALVTPLRVFTALATG